MVTGWTVLADADFTCTCSGQFLCQPTPTLFRPFLAHFFPFFPRFFAVPSSCPQDSGNWHQDPEKRSVTVEKRRAKTPKLTLIFLGVGSSSSSNVKARCPLIADVEVNISAGRSSWPATARSIMKQAGPR